MKDMESTKSTEPKYPDVVVQLTGADGNAAFIIATVMRALHNHGVDSDERNAFMQEAMSGDYTNVLTTCMTWVTVQ